MNAAARTELEDDQFLDVQKLLYAWGDECRSKADELGLPQSSGLKRLIEQRHVMEQLLRGSRRRKRRPKLDEQLTTRSGLRALKCACGKVRFDDKPCPRCSGDPREPDRSVHATATRNFKPMSITSIGSASVRIDAIIATAPNWMRKVLMLSFLFVQRDSVAARRLRVRVSTYEEQKAAAVEYVTKQLAFAESSAL